MKIEGVEISSDTDMKIYLYISFTIWDTATHETTVCVTQFSYVNESL